MASKAGTDAQGEYKTAGCSCKTEQGTGYHVDRGLCELMARSGGFYNPYRDAPKQAQQQQSDRLESEGQAPAPVVAAATGQPFGMVAAYGAVGVGAAHGEPL